MKIVAELKVTVDSNFFRVSFGIQRQLRHRLMIGSFFFLNLELKSVTIQVPIRLQES
jgi:hypothetical protein